LHGFLQLDVQRLNWTAQTQHQSRVQRGTNKRNQMTGIGVSRVEEEKKKRTRKKRGWLRVCVFEQRPCLDKDSSFHRPAFLQNIGKRG
jgi:hypothetical protein